jgi:hypothetical protein
MFGSCFKGVNRNHLESIKNYKYYLVSLDKENNDRTNSLPILPILIKEEQRDDNRCKLQFENTDNSEGCEQCIIPSSE